MLGNPTSVEVSNINFHLFHRCGQKCRHGNNVWMGFVNSPQESVQRRIDPEINYFKSRRAEHNTDEVLPDVMNVTSYRSNYYPAYTSRVDAFEQGLNVRKSGLECICRGKHIRDEESPVFELISD